MHLVDKVTYGNKIAEVSTIDLSIHGLSSYGGFETCIFFEDGSSEVVASYDDVANAKAGHYSFCNPYVVRLVLETVYYRNEAYRNV
jgi:hypothetical protein